MDFFRTRDTLTTVTTITIDSTQRRVRRFLKGRFGSDATYPLNRFRLKSKSSKMRGKVRATVKIKNAEKDNFTPKILISPAASLFSKSSKEIRLILFASVVIVIGPLQNAIFGMKIVL